MSDRQTVFSPCRLYRYTLWREWWRNDLPSPMCRDCADHDGVCPYDGKRCNPEDYIQWIGLNPSTADETKDDPTIRRCIAFSKAWGYGAMCMTNLFAWRATNPKDMMKAASPVGIDNAAHLLDCAKKAGIVIAAWGAHGQHLQQQEFTKRLMQNNHITMHHLGLNGDGTPKHPLYLPKTLTPIPL